MIDARFRGGPWDKQVRPVAEGYSRIPVGEHAHYRIVIRVVRLDDAQRAGMPEITLGLVYRFESTWHSIEAPS